MLTKLLAVGALAAGTALLFGLAHAAPPPSEFEEVEMHVEQNATDGDTEVVITGVASDEGLKRLRVRSPTGRQLVLMQNSKRMQGLREFAFESPEPEGATILDVYPEGTYVFTGASVGGERFRSEVEFEHALPGATTITNPAADAVLDAGDPLTITWTAVPDVAGYLLEFENESVDPEQSLQLNLGAGATSFAVPAALLVPEGEYQVGVATIGDNGNVVFVELNFTTAAAP